MSKQVKDSQSPTEQEVFEIIELAIDDLEVLSKAFNVISDVCSEMNSPEIIFEDKESEQFVH